MGQGGVPKPPSHGFHPVALSALGDINRRLFVPRVAFTMFPNFGVHTAGGFHTYFLRAIVPVPTAGIEPATSPFSGERSYQLSYIGMFARLPAALRCP